MNAERLRELAPGFVKIIYEASKLRNRFVPSIWLVTLSPKSTPDSPFLDADVVSIELDPDRIQDCVTASRLKRMESTPDFTVVALDATRMNLDKPLSPEEMKEVGAAIMDGNGLDAVNRLREAGRLSKPKRFYSFIFQAEGGVMLRSLQPYTRLPNTRVKLTGPLQPEEPTETERTQTVNFDPWVDLSPEEIHRAHQLDNELVSVNANAVLDDHLTFGALFPRSV